MSTQRIVVGVDGSETSRAALRWALEEARLRKAKVDVVHVWTPSHMGADPYAAALLDPNDYEAAAREVLDDVLEHVDASGVPSVEPVLLSGHTADSLVGAAKDAALLVLGSRGRGGFAGLLLGSVSQQVVHHAPCPVVVIPPEG